MSSFQNSFGSQFYTQNDQQQPCFGITIPQKQFKRSQNTQPQFGISNKQKISLMQFQFQQKIVFLKVQLKILQIFNILQPKVSNIKRNTFQALKSQSNPEQISFMHQRLAVQTMTEIFLKIGNFVKRQRTKLLSKAFSNIILKNVYLTQAQHLRNKKKLADKRDSEMLRVHSKFDDSSLHVSDLGMDGEGSNYSTFNGPKVKNKQLKKQKQKFNKNLNDFYAQMDQILSVHEDYLKKK